MKLLPKWILTTGLPASMDHESATAIEQTYKVYKAMQDLITEYNNYVDEVNRKLLDHESKYKSDMETFTTSLRQEFQDFIDVVDLKIQDLETLIGEGSDIDAKLAALETSIRNQLTELENKVNNEINGKIQTIETAVNNLKNDMNGYLNIEIDDVNGVLALPDPMQVESVVKRIQSIYVKSKGVTFTQQGYQDEHEVVKFNYVKINSDDTLYVQVLSISYDDFSITIDDGRTISSGGTIEIETPDGELPDQYKNEAKLLSLTGIYVRSMGISFSSPNLVDTPVSSFITYSFTRINDDGNLIVQQLRISLDNYEIELLAATMANANLIVNVLNSDY